MSPDRGNNRGNNGRNGRRSGISAGRRIIQGKLSIENNACTKEESFFLAMSEIIINPLFKAKLFEYFDYDIEKTFNASKEDLSLFSEYCMDEIPIPKDFLKRRDEINPDKIYEDFKNLQDRENIGFITYNDERYPDLLKNIPDFPLMLYYKGSFDDINFNKAVAFVGSRKASISAKEALFSIISEFKGLDIVVVSGLAEGIDAKSHNAAIENGLKTIGVIGSGFKFQYPSSNKNLYKKIEDSAGLIFSEYPYEAPPLAHQFPQRNRIVTGISYGTVVAEARIKSGAMISARLTLEYGRELMCIPGLISNPNTEGIYYLLKNGASMVTRGEDILEALNWDVILEKKDGPKLNETEEKIYEEISLGAKNIEDLSAALDININDLMVNLTSMELNGLIKQAGGNYFIAG